MSTVNTVLLIEDDRMVRQVLRSVLELENFIVLEASNEQRGMEVLKGHPVQIILMELRLAGGEGLNFILKIRLHTDAPVIIISDQQDPFRKIMCMRAGADDYVSKPFDVEELTARIHAHMRRYQGKSTPYASTRTGNPAPDDRIARAGRWILDSGQFQAFDEKTGASCTLTVDEYHLLSALIRNRNQAMARAQLSDVLSRDSYKPSARAIDIKIARIRRKICDDAANPRIIKTVHGVGYMYVGES